MYFNQCKNCKFCKCNSCKEIGVGCNCNDKNNLIYYRIISLIILSLLGTISITKTTLAATIFNAPLSSNFNDTTGNTTINQNNGSISGGVATYSNQCTTWTNGSDLTPTQFNITGTFNISSFSSNPAPIVLGNQGNGHTPEIFFQILSSGLPQIAQYGGSTFTATTTISTGSHNFQWSWDSSTNNNILKIDGITYLNFTYGSSMVNTGTWTFSIGQPDACNGYTGTMSNLKIDNTVPTPPITPTIYFGYPTNGTTTPAFDNYWIIGTNLTSTDLYSINVSSTEISVAGSKTYSNTIGGNGQDIMYQGRLSPFNQDSSCASFFTNQYSFTATAQLNDITTGQQNIADTTTTFNQLPICGNNSTSTFLTINPILPTSTASSSNGTYNLGTQFPNALGNLEQLQINPDASTTNCTKPSGITDIGGGITYAGCVLFVMPTSSFAYQNLQNAIQSFQTIFPFNLYFGIVGGVESAITTNNTTSSQSLPLTFIGLNGTPYTIINITSSTLTNALTTATETTYFGNTPGCNTSCATHDINNFNNIAKMLIWMTTGIKIVGMIISF